MGRPSQSLEVRFWRFVQKTAGCWKWIGAKDKDGYGKFQVPASLSWDGRTHTTRATRAVLFLTEGRWPEPTIQVQHACDNPSCVRPSHLKKGTASENSEDMRSRGRGPEQRGTWNGGVKNPENARTAKLDWSAVRKIRKKFVEGGRTRAALGREFDVTACTIRDIVLGRTWREGV